MRRLLMPLVPGLVAALVLAPSASAECANADTEPTATNTPELGSALKCLLNERRARRGVHRLGTHRGLAGAAQAHSEHMVAHGYFSHDTPGGVDPFERMKRAGYIGARFSWNASETVAWGEGKLATPRSILRAWLDEPSQRLTLLAPDFRDVGVGVAFGAPVAGGLSGLATATYTVDYGWRVTKKALRRCLNRAAEKQGRARRMHRASCHGL
ncbi:MAG TPA: CAP domain-containing protein [Thermoleophilaceae bacterium]|nr:CAP domain-containing protein [Thermoleophilaceae bacterium]